MSNTATATRAASTICLGRVDRHEIADQHRQRRHWGMIITTPEGGEVQTYHPSPAHAVACAEKWAVARGLRVRLTVTT